MSSQKIQSWNFEATYGGINTMDALQLPLQFAILLFHLAFANFDFFETTVTESL
jgi:hypothetical protein